MEFAHNVRLQSVEFFGWQTKPIHTMYTDVSNNKV